jgi:glyoxylase-like metal-dependent hydrolase (beta-lactamase superfamily II)
MLAKISSIYPHEPIAIEPALRPLAEDGSIPGLPAWKWIHTPGHTPGHVSLFRETDGMLIAGDAFVTVRTDSFYKVLIQKQEVNGPPRYLTTDWDAAYESVRKLNALHPTTVITGHGPAMEGEELRVGLQTLVDDFECLAVPDHGKFVRAEKGD